MFFSGRGAAWLARLLGVQEVPSSNLGSPTKIPHRYTKGGPATGLPVESNWSPFRGLQGTGLAAASGEAFFLSQILWSSLLL